MKAGWEVRPLGEVCDYSRGLTYKKADEVEVSSVRVLRANNVDRDTSLLDLTEIRFLRDDFHVPDAKKTVRNTILICTASGSKSHLGKVALVDTEEDFAFGGFMGLITPSSCLLPNYLHFLMISKTYIDFIDRCTDGANINNLKFSQLSEFEVPIPPLEEQKRIVAVLDAAFEGLTRAKENAEANLQNARELFEATLDRRLVQDALEWPEHELATLGKLTTGGTPKSADSDQYGDAIPFIKPGHFQTDGSLIYDDVGLSKAGMDAARVIPENSALMVCIGATIGKSGHSTREITTNQQINALTPHEGLHHHFVYLNFITPTFQKQVISSSGQATLPIINKTKWGKLKIKVPPTLDEQQAIVKRMIEIRTQVDLATEDYRTKLTDIADLRQSLLQKAFAGELT